MTAFGNIPTKKQLDICQGATLSLTLTFVDTAGAARNLTGYTFRGQIRTPALAASATVSFSYDTTNAATGVILCSLTATQTAAITAGETKNDTASLYYYDMENVDGSGTVDRFLEGNVILNRNVTR